MVWDSASDETAARASSPGVTTPRARRGGEFQVNTYTTGDQEGPALALDAAGDFVVTWVSGGHDGDRQRHLGQTLRRFRCTAGSRVRGEQYTAGDHCSTRGVGRVGQFRGG